MPKTVYVHILKNMNCFETPTTSDEVKVLQLHLFVYSNKLNN